MTRTEPPLHELRGGRVRLGLLWLMGLFLSVGALAAAFDEQALDDAVTRFVVVMGASATLAFLIVCTPPLVRPPRLLVTQSTVTLRHTQGHEDTWALGSCEPFSVLDTKREGESKLVMFNYRDESMDQGFRVVALPDLWFGRRRQHKLAELLNAARATYLENLPDETPMPVLNRRDYSDDYS